MPVELKKISKNGIKYYSIKYSKNFKVKAYFTFRYGGFSQSPYDSLNLGYHVDDDSLAVQKNHIKVAETFRLNSEKIIWVNQIHSTKIAEINRTNLNEFISPENQRKECDGLISNLNHTSLMMFFADCVPLFFCTVKGQLFGLAHAGWKGTINGIASEMVEKIKENPENSDLMDIEVVIGPSIGRCCYEIDKELAEKFILKNNSCVINKNDKYYLDLKGENKRQLLNSGIKPENITTIDECTCCNEEYFSYRRDGVTGRQAAIITKN